MSEVEKLYKKAHIEKVINHECTYDYGITCPNDNDTCDNCGYYKEKEPDYPPFTAEKQLELIKFLSNFWVHINKVNEQFNISTGGGYVSYYAEDLADAIALYINSKWNNLTEQERTEIRSILNG